MQGRGDSRRVTVRGQHRCPDVAQFGPNEWLVDEMYQQYLTDPDRSTRRGGTSSRTTSPDGPRPARAAENGAPATAPRRTTTPAAAGRRGTRRRRPRRRAPTARPRPSRWPRSRPPPRSAAPASRRRGQPPHRPREAVTSTGADVVALKGPAARVVTNMEASLAVPTATSVRAVPAKLLIDNRIVINNHLKRGRGGKVSFTHLIGYAVVEALADDAGDELRLRRGRRQAGRASSPSTSTSAWPSTCQKPDGTRHAARAVHQGRRDDGLRRVLVGVRGHRPPGPHQQADRRRLRRHHDQPDQPGHHRHRPLGAAADGRARARSSASARWSTRPSTRARLPRRSPGWRSARS